MQFRTELKLEQGKEKSFELEEQYCIVNWAYCKKAALKII